MSTDSYEGEDESEGSFRQRLWGAAVFIALMVIFLPLLLDGAGSESQFRRVEKLRQEPPSILDKNGRRSTPSIVESEPGPAIEPAPIKREAPEAPIESVEPIVSASPERETLESILEAVEARKPNSIHIGEEDSPGYMAPEASLTTAAPTLATGKPLTAWVVQTGSFQVYENAQIMRDELRGAGFASFVKDKDTDKGLYRVLVGPMISRQSASNARKKVKNLLQREALVLTYP